MTGTKARWRATLTWELGRLPYNALIAAVGLGSIEGFIRWSTKDYAKSRLPGDPGDATTYVFLGLLALLSFYLLLANALFSVHWLREARAEPARSPDARKRANLVFLVGSLLPAASPLLLVAWGVVSVWSPVSRSKALADRCDFQGALRVLDSLPEPDREKPSVRLLRARYLVQLEENGQALTVLKKLGEETRSPAPRGQLELLSALALFGTGAFDDADNALDRAARDGADGTLVDKARAGVLLRRGKTRQSEELLEDVLRRAPASAETLYDIACVKAKQGDPNWSAALVRRAWKAGFRYPDLLRRDPDLETVRDLHLIDELESSKDGSCSSYY